MTCDNCAHDNRSNCSALKNKVSGECPFAKTREQLDNGRKKAAQRIADLPRDMQAHINQKYYRK